MKIDLNHVALLAKLTLSPEEKVKFSEQINNILKHFETIEKIDVSGLEPMIHGTDFKTRLREDVVGPSLNTKEIYLNAPAFDSDGFEVGKII